MLAVMFNVVFYVFLLRQIVVWWFIGGPKAACIGCAGFAAFSVVIEKFLDRHE